MRSFKNVFVFKLPHFFCQTICYLFVTRFYIAYYNYLILNNVNSPSKQFQTINKVLLAYAEMVQRDFPKYVQDEKLVWVSISLKILKCSSLNYCISFIFRRAC